MHFIVIGIDGTDEGALERRMSARDEHIAYTEANKDHIIMAAAILDADDGGKMVGSNMIVDFPSREDVENWLSKEPYICNDVWQEINIMPAAVGPSFLKD